MIGRSFGWFCLFAAAVILVRDALVWHDVGKLAPETFNELWFDLSSNSLGIFRGSVESTMPWFWNLVVAPFLSLWAAPVLFLLAIFLTWRRGATGARRP
ncbi:MAG TPA: hypothetical protein VGP48_11760 [Stellaceae bacterium]|jgi:hypothetical protein|nr:hypothetical protein [Stellaceae bacterium]